MHLKQWRDKNGLTVAQAVERLDISQPTINRIERGLQLPGPATIAKLSKATDGAITGVDLFKAWERLQEASAA